MMLKVFKKESNCNNNFEVRIFNMKTGEFTHYYQDKNIGFTFSYYNTTVQKMGYKDVNTCIKELKRRGYIKDTEEITIQEQEESEKIGWINLGVERIKRANRINTNDFIDVVERLKNYGIGFCDAQNIITASYLNC